MRGPLVLGCVWLGLLVACGPAENTERRHGVAEDARALAAILDSDPTGQAIDDADDAVDTNRPVMAAGILTEAALPATLRQIERIEALEPTTSEGRSLRSRALRVHRARMTGLEHYRDALARGVDEDEVLLDGLHETSVAERDLLALRNDLVAHAPLSAPAEPSDLPPVSTPRADDGDSTAEPEEAVDEPGELDDALPEM